MKLQEVFEKCGVESDAKARRVTNIAPNQTANITADEIESGVTIERLESIGVPVLKYSGQITIHGKLPAFNEFARPGGYKAVFQNQNGSIGVRYVALDAEKKKTIADASHYAKSVWSASINSKGLELFGFFHEKEPCIEAYRSFPRELFAGGICAGAGAFGGYYVIVAIGAIYERHVWPLIAHCWQFQSADDLNAVKEQKRLEHEAQQAVYEQQRKERDAAEAAKRNEIISTIGLAPLKALPKGECTFVRVLDTWNNGPQPMLYIVRKKAFGLCYSYRNWTPGLTTFEPDRFKKMKRFDSDKRTSIERAIAQGLVFQPA